MKLFIRKKIIGLVAVLSVALFIGSNNLVVAQVPVGEDASGVPSVTNPVNEDQCPDFEDPRTAPSGSQGCVSDSDPSADDDGCPVGRDPGTLDDGTQGCLEEDHPNLNASATTPELGTVSEGGGTQPGGGPGTPTAGSDGVSPPEDTGDDDVTPAEGAALEADCVGANLNEGNCGIIKWIQIFINALTAVFGIIAVIMIAVGGVQYSFARDNPQQAAAAKERIRNVIIAIVAYVFLYGFIQYIIPGGIL